MARRGSDHHQGLRTPWNGPLDESALQSKSRKIALEHANLNRFLVDSRDQASRERLDDLEDSYRLFRCRTIMNCTNACPKGLNPAGAISKIRGMMVRRAV